MFSAEQTRDRLEAFPARGVTLLCGSNLTRLEPRKRWVARACRQCVPQIAGPQGLQWNSLHRLLTLG